MNPQEYIDEYHRKLKQNPHNKGSVLYPQQEKSIKLTIEAFLPRYEQYANLLAVPPSTNASMAEQERYRHRLNDESQYWGWGKWWEVGTGKTPLSIALAHILHMAFPRILRDDKGILPTLIVCKKTSIDDTWVTHLREWGIHDPDTLLVVHSSEEIYKATIIARTIRPMFVLAAYDTIRCDRNRDKKHYDNFQQVPWGIIITDEVHMIKHSDSARAQAINMLPNRIRIPLGGTPMTNRGNDMHSPLAFTRGFTVIGQRQDGSTYPIKHSKEVGTYEDFLQNYSIIAGSRVVGSKNLSPGTCIECSHSRCLRCHYYSLVPGVRDKYCAKCTKPIHPTCLQCRFPLHNLMKIMSDRERSTVGPCKIITKHHGLTEIQIKAYNQLREGYLSFMNSGQRDKMTVANILTQWNYFRQLSSDMRQLAKSVQRYVAKSNSEMVFLNHVDTRQLSSLLKLDTVSPKQLSGKLNELDSLLEDEVDLFDTSNSIQKMIVFTPFVTTAQVLKEHYRRFNPVVIDSESNQRGTTHRYCETFRQVDNCRMLIGTAAAQDSLNLQIASYVTIYGHFSWNATDINQAIARAQRNGRIGQLTVFKMLAEGFEVNLEEKWLSKQIDFDAAMDGNSTLRSSRWMDMNAVTMI